MSHLANAPLRPRRHSDAAYDTLNTRKTFDYDTYDTTAALDAPSNDSSFSSSSSSARRPLKLLLLPAQLEIRRVTERFELLSGPKRLALESSHRSHRLFPRQSTSTATATEQALRRVTASTDCRALITAYDGALAAGPLRRACYQRVADETRAAAASSSSQAAAAATRRPLSTVTVASAPTGRVAAPLDTASQPLASAVDSAFSAAVSAVNSQAAASSASRAVIAASVESLFSQAYSEVSSRRAAATASSTVPSSTLPPSSSSSLPTSSSSTLPSSSSTASSSSSSSGAGASATAAPARSNHDRLVNIVVPSVVIPVGVILIIILALCCWKRRRRRDGAAGGGLGPISNPQPLRAAPRAYAGGAAGAAAIGAAAGAAAGGRQPGSSQESLGTTPSAIGVAFSEPRTRWGRRSLVDVLAGGVRSANTPVTASPTPSGSVSHDQHQRGHAHTGSFGGGRQPSILSTPSIASEYRGVGGYNSHSGYKPGQPRPVMAPLSPHYDPYGYPTIVPVPSAAAQRTGSAAAGGFVPQHHPSSSESSHSGYGGSESDARSRSASSSQSLTARFAPPLAGGYAHAPAAAASRLTQNTTDGAEGYWTADPGPSSTSGHEMYGTGEDDDAAEELSLAGASSGRFSGSPEEQAVNFGSSSSGSASGSGSRGSRHTSEDPNATPRIPSGASTPRLGAGHGSGFGNRRNDGTGSWWN